jgi:hypothetical protein
MSQAVSNRGSAVPSEPESSAVLSAVPAGPRLLDAPARPSSEGGVAAELSRQPCQVAHPVEPVQWAANGEVERERMPSASASVLRHERRTAAEALSDPVRVSGAAALPSPCRDWPTLWEEEAATDAAATTPTRPLAVEVPAPCAVVGRGAASTRVPSVTSWPSEAWPRGRLPPAPARFAWLFPLSIVEILRGHLQKSSPPLKYYKITTYRFYSSPK